MAKGREALVSMMGDLTKLPWYLSEGITIPTQACTSTCNYQSQLPSTSNCELPNYLSQLPSTSNCELPNYLSQLPSTSNCELPNYLSQLPPCAPSIPPHWIPTLIFPDPLAREPQAPEVSQLVREVREHLDAASRKLASLERLLTSTPNRDFDHPPPITDSVNYH
eukprot:XP_011677937.1 PREDICTED: uncharacterized protein LOC105444858 [Strongylocentrotus purpuratus]